MDLETKPSKMSNNARSLMMGDITPQLNEANCVHVNAGNRCHLSCIPTVSTLQYGSQIESSWDCNCGRQGLVRDQS